MPLTSHARLACLSAARPAFLAAAAITLTTALAQAQDCPPTWSSAFTSARLDGTPHIFRSMPDGTLIAGGRFDAAGGLPAQNIAQWDGDSWHPVGAGLPFRVRTLEEFDSGQGPLLYACGSLIDGNNDGGARVARWDGQAWTIIAESPDGGVRASAIFDDGSGPALYCLGSFTQIAGIPAAGAARFDGQSWTALASGLTGYANAAAVFDDGSGPALYVGGKIASAGGTPVKGIARWSGAAWTEVGGGVTNQFGDPGEVDSLAVHSEPGDVPRLYVGGDFASVNDNIPALRAAAWNESGWIPLTGITDPVYELATMPAGNTEQLWAAASRDYQGYFTTSVYTLTGTEWARTPDYYVPGQAFALASYPFNGQPAMHIGTAYDGAVRAWHDQAWLALGKGFISGISAIREFDRGHGPEVLVAGRFDEIAGKQTTPNLAAWDGSTWTSVAVKTPESLRDFEVFDDGSGPALFACAEAPFAGYIYAARLSGDHWVPIGGSPSPTSDLQLFDDGSGMALYGAGSESVARLENGAWAPLGLPFTGVEFTRCLAVFNDGHGPALYVGGAIAKNGNANVNGIARWDGAKWNTVGKGFYGGDGFTSVNTMAAFDDGAGPALFAGGRFAHADGNPAGNIARWDGQHWSALGGGVNGEVLSMAVFDDGSDQALFVSGIFSTAGGIPVFGIAKWTAAGWQPVGSGFDTYGSAQAMSPSSLDGGSLFLGGGFDSADGVSASNFTQVTSCHACFADFDADGSLTLFDFLAFVNAFNAADPAADCDHSGSLDLFDFLCFTNSFNAGC